MLAIFRSMGLILLLVPQLVFAAPKNCLADLEAGTRKLWAETQPYAYDTEATRENTFVIDGGPPTLSGSLHMGHVMSYVPVDVIARFHRMNGKTVFYPMGLDTNGQPTMKLIENTLGVYISKVVTSTEAIDWSRAAEGIEPGSSRAISRSQARDACDYLVCQRSAEYWDLWERLGIGLDPKLAYHTLDDNHFRLSQDMFLKLAAEGVVAEQIPSHKLPANLAPSTDENDGDVLNFVDASGRVSPIWFMRMNEYKDRLSVHADKVQIAGIVSKEALKKNIKNIDRDWGLTRSRHFGIPIPVWYPITHAGIDFSKPIFARPEQLPVDPTVDTPPGYNADQRGRTGGFTADNNVLDTWFTSTMTFLLQPLIHGDPERGKLYPADLRTHGFDVLYAWTVRGLFRSMLFDESRPGFQSVIVHGNVLGPDGKKMSKSVGNVIDPLDLLAKHGGDPIRYWAIILKPTVSRYSPEAVTEGEVLISQAVERAKTYRWLLNYLPSLSDLSDVDITSPYDLAYLSLLDQTIREVTDLLKSHPYDYKAAMVKVAEGFRLFQGYYLTETAWRRDSRKHQDMKDLRSAMATMRLGLITYAKLFAPFLPYTAEAMWNELGLTPGQSVHSQSWPTTLSSTHHVTPEVRRAFLVFREVTNFAGRLNRKRSKTIQGLKIYASAEDIEALAKAFEPMGLRSYLKLVGPVEYSSDTTRIPFRERVLIQFEQQL